MKFRLSTIALLGVLVSCGDVRTNSSSTSKDQPPPSQSAPSGGAAATFIEGTWRQECQANRRRSTIVMTGSIYHRTVLEYGNTDCSGAPTSTVVDYTTSFKITAPDDDTFPNSIELWDLTADSYWFREDFYLNVETDGRFYLSFSSEPDPARYYQVKVP